MSIDSLQETIRKLKNPLIVDLSLCPADLPPQLMERSDHFLSGYDRFCTELVDAFKGVVPGLRFSFGMFALYGAEGIELLSKLLSESKKRGYYTIMDAPDMLSPQMASLTAAKLMEDDSIFSSDALVISPYIGSDAIKPFLPYCKEAGSDLFVIVRSPNKSASELQDLMTGSRFVHGAAADLVSRHGENLYGKSGYSQVCALVSAGSAESIRSLRGKYKHMFLLVDGLDYPSGNAKNCSFAFDRFGHGAAVCVGTLVTGAWKAAQSDAADYAESAVLAAERIRKNLLRYLAIL